MAVTFEQTVALLARTPAALDGLLRGLPDAWTTHNEGQGSWSVFEVVAHLIHGEQTNWMPRARVILEFGDSRALPPFKRDGNFLQSRARPLEELLNEFSQTRRESLRELSALNLLPQHLERRGQHPALGTVTLGDLLGAWAVHDLTHLHQVTRVLAFQSRDGVGAFSKYLGVLKCSGHGE